MDECIIQSDDSKKLKDLMGENNVDLKSLNNDCKELNDSIQNGIRKTIEQTENQLNDLSLNDKSKRAEDDVSEDEYYDVTSDGSNSETSLIVDQKERQSIDKLNGENEHIETDKINKSGDEREQGDGEESNDVHVTENLDDDEDKRNPQYIPKRGAFYEHDDRMLVEDDNKEEVSEEKKSDIVQIEQKELIGKKKASKWSHDLFDFNKQVPKSNDELVYTYGYDIRGDNDAPKSRRRKRYNRGPNRYTRDWKDEDAYNQSNRQIGAPIDRKSRKDRNERNKEERNLSVDKNNLRKEQLDSLSTIETKVKQQSDKLTTTSTLFKQSTNENKNVLSENFLLASSITSNSSKKKDSEISNRTSLARDRFNRRSMDDTRYDRNDDSKSNKREERRENQRGNRRDGRRDDTKDNQRDNFREDYQPRTRLPRENFRHKNGGNRGDFFSKDESFNSDRRMMPKERRREYDDNYRRRRDLDKDDRRPDYRNKFYGDEKFNNEKINDEFSNNKSRQEKKTFSNEDFPQLSDNNEAFLKSKNDKFIEDSNNWGKYNKLTIGNVNETEKKSMEDKKRDERINSFKKDKSDGSNKIQTFNESRTSSSNNKRQDQLNNYKLTSGASSSKNSKEGRDYQKGNRTYNNDRRNKNFENNSKSLVDNQQSPSQQQMNTRQNISNPSTPTKSLINQLPLNETIKRDDVEKLNIRDDQSKLVGNSQNDQLEIKDDLNSEYQNIDQKELKNNSKKKYQNQESNNIYKSNQQLNIIKTTSSSIQQISLSSLSASISQHTQQRSIQQAVTQQQSQQSLISTTPNKIIASSQAKSHSVLSTNQAVTTPILAQQPQLITTTPTQSQQTAHHHTQLINSVQSNNQINSATIQQHQIGTAHLTNPALQTSHISHTSQYTTQSTHHQNLARPQTYYDATRQTQAAYYTPTDNHNSPRSSFAYIQSTPQHNDNTPSYLTHSQLATQYPTTPYAATNAVTSNPVVQQPDQTYLPPTAYHQYASYAPSAAPTYTQYPQTYQHAPTGQGVSRNGVTYYTDYTNTQPGMQYTNNNMTRQMSRGKRQNNALAIISPDGILQPQQYN